MRATILMVLMAGVTCFGASQVQAQGGPAVGRYAPARPPISPYLYLSRGSVGGVPAYYAWVRPQIEYQQQVGQFNQQIQQLDQRTLTNQRLLNDPRVPLVGQPSTAATFMNYSHYYQQSTGPRR